MITDVKSITVELNNLDKIDPPDFVPSSMCYETVTGSVAYGVANEKSDLDVKGFCVPPREVVFPHLRGEIPMFGSQKQRFGQFQAHGLEWRGEDLDLTIHSIVRFFDLCMDNNPNHIETLFTPEDCIIKTGPVAQMVRDNRRMFLNKKSYHAFKGFAWSQISKLKKRDRSEDRLRKYGYHAVRLLDEAEGILSDRMLSIDDNVDKLTAVREGEWSLDEVESYFDDKMKQLETLYDESDALPWGPPEEDLRELLLNCLEEVWGDLRECLPREDRLDS